MKAFFITICILFSLVSNAKLKEIPIGLASNFSEVSSSSSNPFGGYFKDGVALALKELAPNLAKKGLKVKIRKFDYGTSDIRVLKAAKAAVASDVLAVLGYNFSSHALLAGPIHNKSRLPMLTPSATANRLNTMGSYVHLGSFDNEYMGKALAKIAIGKLKVKKAAIVANADCAYCMDLGKSFEHEFKSLGGEITVTSLTLQNDRDFSKSIQTLKNKDFDVIVVPNQELPSARIISALLSSGIDKPFLGGDGWGNVGEEFFGILKSHKLRGYSVSHWHPEEKSKASKMFIKAYRENFQKDPNDTSVLAYDSMRLLVQAILAAKKLTREGIETSLNNLSDFTGVTGKYFLNKNKAPAKSLVLLEANNRKFKVLELIHPHQRSL